jgi:NAD(P)-dependent dehydrogenase (short-subunit alcohol dehydrogenase family)
VGAANALRAVLFQLPVGARVELRAAVFPLAMRAGGAHHTMASLLSMRASFSFHRVSCTTVSRRFQVRPPAAIASTQLFTPLASVASEASVRERHESARHEVWSFMCPDSFSVLASFQEFCKPTRLFLNLRIACDARRCASVDSGRRTMSEVPAVAEPVHGDERDGFDISDDSLARLVRTIENFTRDPEKFESESRFRPLRRALEPLMAQYATRQGEILEKARRRQLRKEAEGRAYKQAHQDKIHRDNTRLRFGRIENLAALCEDGGGGVRGGSALASIEAVAGLLGDATTGDGTGRSLAYLSQVPDGAVKDGGRRANADVPRLADDASTKTENEVGVEKASADVAHAIGVDSTESKASDHESIGTSLHTQFSSDHSTNPQKSLHTKRQCYTCKARFSILHHFYAQFCENCAAVNWRMREFSVDLNGKVALLTGSRVKIGFETGLKLLRAGATLIATSRFPADTHKRYAREDDYESWKHKLHIHAVDLRDVFGLERFCQMLIETLPRLDIVVNNACQTVRRPVSYYTHLLPAERQLELAMAGNISNSSRGDENGTCSDTVPPTLTGHAEHVLRERATRGVTTNISDCTPRLITDGDDLASDVANVDHDLFFPSPAQLSQLKLADDDQYTLPVMGALDVNGQQIDLRTNNSWRLKLDEVELPELTEVFAINAMAPFILNARLQPLLEKSARGEPSVGTTGHPPSGKAFIVNVSAMEGKFYRHKTPNHPHTNMAKAALNMMTRTVAAELAETHGIYMTAVDTGWINDENPREIAARIAKAHEFQTPIDEVDAAARVLHPVFHGFTQNTEPLRGVFLKDYVATEW